ncbi:hypothetical protein V3C33_08485 [Micrococcaceae bacterium Sec5.7]
MDPTSQQPNPTRKLPQTDLVAGPVDRLETMVPYGLPRRSGLTE